MTEASSRWFPVATELDLVPRHVFHGQLLGRELAIWRAEDGFVNVWENRCLHRGVRLTIGSSDGNELTCRYHGWRYSNRTAGCTYIPAHPADAPARTICNRTFPAVLRYGLVWSGESPVGEPPSVGCLDEGTPFGLRNLPVNASVDVVLGHLRDHRFGPSGATATIDELDDHSLALTEVAAGTSSTVVFFVQPVDSARSVIRAVLADAPAEADRMDVLRHHAVRLARTVEAIETAAAALPAPEPMVPAIEQVPVRLAGLPEPAGRNAPLRARVARKWLTAADVMAFELAPVSATGDALPTFQPGAHIDVHLPNGLVRQYSLTNGPGETAAYRIGVKLDPNSRGGSVCLHETVREGDVLAISEPRNNFPLRRDTPRTILVAGGIGVTPLLAMAQALAAMSLPFELHYFARTHDDLAFGEVRSELGDSVVTHLGLDASETGAALTRLLAAPDGNSQVYVCGPPPMLDATRRIAADAGWPESAVHFEYFANPTDIDDSSSFEIALARSAVTLAVPAGRTILEVVRDHGLAIASSCEQGACGTCMVPVIEGEIDHQDVYLGAAERRAGDKILTCVSRAAGERLVLDL